MKTLKLKSVSKKAAIGTLLVLGIIGADTGIKQIQLSDYDYKATRNYYATQCWRGNGLQWSELGLMNDIFNSELKEMPISVSNMLIGIKQKEGVKKFCKAMIRL